MDNREWILTVFNDESDFDANNKRFISIAHNNKESLLKDISRMIDCKKPITICEVLHEMV